MTVNTHPRTTIGVLAHDSQCSPLDHKSSWGFFITVCVTVVRECLSRLPCRRTRGARAGWCPCASPPWWTWPTTRPCATGWPVAAPSGSPVKNSWWVVMGRFLSSVICPVIIMMDICKAPTLRLKVVNENNMTHIMYMYWDGKCYQPFNK